MFPCEMARYIAGFRKEARKYGRFWVFSPRQAPDRYCFWLWHTLGLWDPPHQSRMRGGHAKEITRRRCDEPALSRQLKFREGDLRSRFIQRKQLGRSRIRAARRNNGGRRQPNQPAEHGATCDRVMSLAGLDQKIVGTAGYRAKSGAVGYRAKSGAVSPGNSASAATS